MTESSLIERITRSLAYMLRHKPEQFDLEVDAHGFAPVGDVLQALTERLGERVEFEDLEDAVLAGDRRRYEIEGDRVRALYGHSIPIEPGPESEPPEQLFLAIPARDVPQAQRGGLRGGRRSFLHLALTPEEALETGRRLAREYTLIIVHAAEAFENGVPFYDRKALFLAEELPKECLEIGETFDDGEEPQRRGFQGGGARGRVERPGARRPERAAGPQSDWSRAPQAPEEEPIQSDEEPAPAGDLGAEASDGGDTGEQRRRRRRRGRRGRRELLEGESPESQGAGPEPYDRPELPELPEEPAGYAAPRAAPRAPERAGWAARDEARPAREAGEGYRDTPPGRLGGEGGQRADWRERRDAAARFPRDEHQGAAPERPQAPRGERFERAPREGARGERFERAPAESGERQARGGRPERGFPRDEGDRREARPEREERAAFEPRAPREERPRVREEQEPRFAREERAPREERGYRDERPRSDRPREERPSEERSYREERPPRAERGYREDRPREDRPREDRPREDRPREDRPREDRPREERGFREDRPREERGPREDRARPRFADSGPGDRPPATARIQRAEPKPTPQAAARPPETPADDGSFGLGIFEAPTRAPQRPPSEPPPARPPAPRPPAPPPPVDDGFGTGVL